jgi:hypothetical protein
MATRAVGADGVVTRPPLELDIDPPPQPKLSPANSKALKAPTLPGPILERLAATES